MSRSAAAALAAGVPLTLYIATVGGDGYWLDAGEFVAASVMLDIAHPPGHPLAQLWGKIWTLFPFGPLAFRVALGQAVAAGLGAACLFRAIERSVGFFRGVGPALATTIACLGTWLPMLSFPLWFQAVRPEVYALHGALLFAAMERITRAAELEFSDARPLYGACLWVGLGLANHHFTAFLFFPTLLLAAFWVASNRGLGTIARCAGCGIAGLATYAYLPARALTRPPLNLGDPSTLERIYWVVSARVYAKNVDMVHPQSLGERFGDVLIAIVGSLHIPFVLLALAGIYLSLRHSRTRRLGLLWVFMACLPLYFRAWLGHVRGNPDALGYLFAAMGGMGALLALALAAFSSVISRAKRWMRPWSLALALLSVSVVVFQARESFASKDLASFHGLEPFDEARIDRLPPRSVVLATDPSTVFRYWQEAVGPRVRPDIAVLPLPFVTYPGVAEGLRREQPDLHETVDSYLARGSLSAKALRALARRRPVFVEMDLRAQPSLYAEMLPRGPFHQVLSESGGKEARMAEAVRHHDRTFARIYHRLGTQIREPETSRQLLRMHYTGALHFAAVGLRDLALAEVARALALHPHDLHVLRLEQALMGWDEDSPFDLRVHFQLD